MTVIIYKIETNRMQENASELNKKLSWFNLFGFLTQFFHGGSNSEFEMGIVENNIEQILQWDQNSKQSKLEKRLVQIVLVNHWVSLLLLPLIYFFFFFSSLGSTHYCETNSDGEASWKRTIWWSVDGQMEGWKSRSESVFHHRRSQLVPRNRDLPNCFNASWKHPW